MPRRPPLLTNTDEANVIRREDSIFLYMQLLGAVATGIEFAILTYRQLNLESRNRHAPTTPLDQQALVLIVFSTALLLGMLYGQAVTSLSHPIVRSLGFTRAAAQNLEFIRQTNTQAHQRTADSSALLATVFAGLAAWVSIGYGLSRQQNTPMETGLLLTLTAMLTSFAAGAGFSIPAISARQADANLYRTTHPAGRLSPSAGYQQRFQGSDSDSDFGYDSEID